VASYSYVRNAASAVVFDNRVYIFGGNSPSDSPISQCEVYDDKKNSWNMWLTAAPTSRSYLTTVVVGTVILVMGGLRGDARTDLIEEYTPSTNTWRTLSWKLPQSRYDFGASFNATTGVLMIGGGKGDESTSKNVYTRKQPFESNEWILCSGVQYNAKSACSVSLC
jgi:N-acetylneuraminic acid mutarotase